MVDEDAAGHNLAVTGASPLGGRCGARSSKEHARERPALAGYEGEVGIRHGLEGYFAASAFAVQIHDREVAKQVLEIGRQRSGMVSGAKPHMAGRMWDLVAQAWLRCPAPLLVEAHRRFDRVTRPRSEPFLNQSLIPLRLRDRKRQHTTPRVVRHGPPDGNNSTKGFVNLCTTAAKH